MIRRILPLLVLVLLGALFLSSALTGCDIVLSIRVTATPGAGAPVIVLGVGQTPSSTAVPPSPTAVPPSPTQVPPSPTAVPPSPTPSSTGEPAVAASPTKLTAGTEGPAAPKLLDPPDEYVASAVDLKWEWAGELGKGDWFELYIWPDKPDAEPQVYGWYKEPPVRVTAANLLPGRYRWKVIVVKGRGEERTDELTPPSEEWRFTIVRPSVIGDISVPSPVMPTRMFTPVPTATRTPRPFVPSATPRNTATNTPTSPTATPSPLPPTATATSEAPYPEPTATLPPATATSTPVITNTPAPKITDTPVPPTAVPTGTTEPYPVGPTEAPTTQPTPVPTTQPTSAYP
ncbi:MAG: hypothetical protein H5T69_05480 [Chloroflexi bacterium]|nr:hypothetical protein [Chloroflexota bacterium]